jgi:hypothetical protein
MTANTDSIRKVSRKLALATGDDDPASSGIVAGEADEHEQQDYLDAEAEADAIIARAKARARAETSSSSITGSSAKDRTNGGDGGDMEVDRASFASAIAAEMADAEAAAHAHAVNLAYRRTFRGAYMRVPPAGASAREREKKQQRAAAKETYVKGGKPKGAPVFGAASRRF